MITSIKKFVYKLKLRCVDHFSKLHIKIYKCLDQGYPNGGEFSLGRPGGGKFKTFGNFKWYTLKLIIDILELQMKSKKQVLDVLISNTETFTRYS